MVSTFKRTAKRMAVEAVARVAPLAWRTRKSGSLVVLMYHRVLPTGSPALKLEQPGMYVAPETLDMHLTELRRWFEIVYLDDWLRRAREGSALPRIACAITFDDGWQDNFEYATPLLVKHAAPATVFLVSEYVGTAYRFWPNRLMALLRTAYRQPDAVTFPSSLRRIVSPVLADAKARGELSADDVDRAVQRTKVLDERAIRALIEATAAPDDASPTSRDLLDRDEIGRMAETGLVRFGSHTATHFRLGGNPSPTDLEREIVTSRRTLQLLTGQTIELFCYPNGETSAAAVECVRRHYRGAVTTSPGWHVEGSDAHLIRRIGVHDDVSDTGEAFIARLSGWL